VTDGKDAEEVVGPVDPLYDENLDDDDELWVSMNMGA
jgi:hypothetical protein